MVRSHAVDVTSSQTRLTSSLRGSATAPNMVVVQNADNTNPVWLGGDDVTMGEGVELAAGESLTLELVQCHLYGVAQTGTVECRVLETQA